MNTTLRRRQGMALLFGLLMVLPVWASTFAITEDELDPEIFPQVAESIRTNLDQIGRRKLSSASREVVLRSLERMERYLAEDPRHHHSRIRAEQRRVNSALLPAVTQNDGESEVVCKRVKNVGSNIMRTECRTRAEIELEQQAAHRLLTRPQTQCGLKVCLPPGQGTIGRGGEN